MMLIYTISALRKYARAAYIEAIQTGIGFRGFMKLLEKDEIYVCASRTLYSITIKYHGVKIDI